MRKNICRVVRQELDELMLGETGSASAVEHLRECAACREFHQQQTSLRKIVGSLGTVAAPADFDFRLRARLAGDSSNAGLAWPFARRGFALATMLLVFATGAVLMRNVLNRPPKEEVVTTTNQPAVVPEPPKQVETKDPKAQSSPELIATVPQKRPQTIKSERRSSTASKTPRRLVAEDFSSTRAEVISGQDPASESDAFPLDASLQSFKVLLDDGRGNARTISVPTVSFGSQRMLQTGNQFAPKRVW
jgi:hypothetical protein